METETIYLYPDDDIVSIRDRLDWVKGPRVVLVLPEDGELLNSPLDLSLLQRHAAGLRLEIGLVSSDESIVRQAKELGFATFSSVRSATKGKRRWWRARRKRPPPVSPAKLDKADLSEMQRRKAERPIWQRWMLRYLAIVAYVLTLAALFIAAVYAIPGATITLEPEVRTVQVLRQIVADPQLEEVEASGLSVPGRVLVTIQEWEADVETTGTIEVPDARAQGRVIFVNQLDQPVTVPAGVRVSTSAGSRIIFQTLSPVEVPGVVGGTVETDAVAVEPGDLGNVAANLINRIEGPLSLQLQVRNLEPFTGGGVRVERAVTEEDQRRLRSQVLQQIQLLSLAELQSQVERQEFLARDSLRLARILHETYSHFPGEQTDRLGLDIRAEFQATAVDEAQAVGLVYEAVAAAVEDGFKLVPDSLSFSSGEVIGVDDEGRVTFEMIGSGRMAADLALSEPLRRVLGQRVEPAMAHLYESLPLQEYPSAQVWPSWFERIPFLPVRVSTDVVTD
jgi:hypothetical protein